ncbi:MAG: lysoplasmalogenase [Armatimonadota bacterium]|nr:MAG: lysoplasmalogenase [Armatimonadota bacterium]
MGYSLLLVAVILAAVDWVGVAREERRLEYAFKPLVMIVLLAWLWQATGLRGWAAWFAFGVVFSLAGDVFLMLPRDLFLAGLVSFLLAQVAYAVGFNPTLPALNLGALLLAAVVAAYASWIYLHLSRGLRARNEAGLAAPVLVYAVVISAMVLSALLTLMRPEWNRVHALIASAGAVLFLASDSMLAWDRFVRPFPGARLKVMVTYHLGQVGILVGAGLHLAALN